MMKKLLLFFLVISTFSAFAQDITFDGNNCKPGANSEWGLPDYADGDTDGDGYGNRDTPTGTADVLNLWYRQYPEYFLLAFERRKTGNSYFVFYLNTDCDPTTGDTTRDGADIALAFDISPGITPEITDNLIYEWNNTEYTSTGKTFEAKVGRESCDGALGKFFEFRIRIADIFEVCGNTGSCHNITFNHAASLAGGSPNSAPKDVFEVPIAAGINSDPTAAINMPSSACALDEIILDGSASTAYNSALYTEEDAPDFMDDIVAYEWDLDYDGKNFSADLTGPVASASFQKSGRYNIALKVTDSYGCTHLATQFIRVKKTPMALFDFTISDNCGMQIAFDAGSSKPSTKNKCITTYEWDFDYDGSFQTNATGISPEWDFGTCGTFNVALKVTENSDQCNSNIIVKTVEIADNQAPEFTVPPNRELPADTDPLNLELTGKVTDAADNCLVDSVSFTDVSETDSCGGSIISRRWTVTDGCGNETSKTQKITLVNMEVPYEVTAPDDINLECGFNYIPCIDFEGIDNAAQFTHAGRTVTITAGSAKGNRIPNLFDSAHPSVFDQDLGTPNSDFDGPGLGADGNDGSPYVNFIPQENILIVQDPAYTTPNDLSEKGTFLEFDLSAFNGVRMEAISILDIEQNQTNKKIELLDSSRNLIGTANIPATGDNGAVTIDLSTFTGVYYLRAILDGSGAIASLCFHNDSFDSGQASISEACTSAPGLWYEDQVSSGNCGVQEITRTWKTIDRKGNIYEDVQTLTFLDNQAPTFNEPLPQKSTEVNCGNIPAAENLTATDNCDPDVTIVFEEAQTGMDDSCSSEYMITRSWTATDCSGNSTTYTQEIRVIDTTAPVFTNPLPSDLTLGCYEHTEVTELQATDNCSDQVEVTLQEEINNTDTCGNPTMITRTWTAADCAGNTTTHQQVITIKDEDPPVFNESLPQDTTLQCEAIPEAAVLTATDACSGTLELTFEEYVSETNSCGTATVIVRTWTATDCAGNAVTHSQTITVADEAAPVFNENLPANVTVNCSTIPPMVSLTATDNCEVAVIVESSEEVIPGNCPGAAQIIRTWTATDCAGNTSSHTQTITVEDNEAPELVSPLETDIAVICGNIPEVPELEFTDTCGGAVTVEFETSNDRDPASGDYQIERTWSATDACGNTATFVQTIFVMNESEEIILAPVTLCVEDSAINLENLLPTQVRGSGTWKLTGGSYTPENGIFDPFESTTGNYRLTYEGIDDQCSVTYELDIEVHDDCVVLPCSSADEVVISKAVTPNGDGYNDYFTVKGTNEACGFRIKVQIFNRWEQLVYESNNYQNDWSGIASDSAVGGSGQVPAGTYYYIVTLVDSGLEPFTGSIYVGTGS